MNTTKKRKTISHGSNQGSTSGSITATDTETATVNLLKSFEKESSTIQNVLPRTQNLQDGNGEPNGNSTFSSDNTISTKASSSVHSSPGSVCISHTHGSPVHNNLQSSSNSLYSRNMMSPRPGSVLSPGSISDSSSRSTLSERDSPSDFPSYDKNFRVPKSHRLITVNQLMSDNPPCRQTVIYLIFLRVVSSSYNNESRSFTIRNIGKKNQSQSVNLYSRLLLCMDPNTVDGQTVYIVQGRGISMNLWSKNANYRDDGTITVGSVLAIISPKPITKLLANEVPILETNFSSLLMKRKTLHPIPIDTSIPEMTTKGFILNGTYIRVDAVEALQTKCHGHFCDRQRCAELIRADKSCGCYFMRGIHSGIALVHRIQVNCGDGEILTMDEFSSMKFSLLYLSEYFPNSTKRIDFDASEHLETLYDCIDNVINFYNSNGGFTIIGWYKRGEINDSSNDDNNQKITSSSVGQHIISIYPSLYIHGHAPETNDMKFNVSCVSGM